MRNPTRSRMVRLALSFGLALLPALFAACSNEDPSAAGPDAEEATGRAEIRLPAIPKGFAVRKPAASAAAEDSQDLAFILTVTGPGMVARRQVWNLDGQGGSVTVTGIPVGERMFRGELEVNGHVTHEDSVLVFIEGGRTTQVDLHLRPNRGDATVCVSIEGLPPPPGCLPPRDPIPVAGCYRLDVVGPFGMASASLRIVQEDTLLEGYLTWPDGVDTANGIIHRDGTLRFGGDLPGAFELSGWYDTVFAEMRGTAFRSPRRQVEGDFAGVPSECAVEPPAGGIDSAFSCFTVTQSFDGTTESGGTLVVQERGIQLYGVFRWRGLYVMPVTGLVTSGGGLATWHLSGILARDIYYNPGNPSNEMQYLASRRVWDRALEPGAIYWSPDRLGRPVGTWTSVLRTCRDADVADVRAFFK